MQCCAARKDILIEYNLRVVHRLAIARILLCSPGAEKQIGAGKLVGIGCKILRPHAAVAESIDRRIAEQLFCTGCGQIECTVIIFERGRGSKLTYFSCSAIRRGNALRKLTDATEQAGAQLAVKRADRALRDRR